MPDPTPHLLDQLAERGRAQAPALVLRDTVLTYEALRNRVSLLAAWLAEQARPGARVASWAAKGELTCLLPLAAARAGLVHVPINPLLKRAQVAHILADSGAVLLLGTKARLASLETGDVPTGCRFLEESETFARAEERNGALPPSAHDPDALAAILYTSGSTGKPKGVMLSHANMWLGAVSVAHYLGMTADDVTLAVLPLSFDYGQSQLLSTWYAGGCVVPLDYLFPRDVAKACARHGVTTLAAVPPLWVQLTEIDWPVEAVAAMRRLTNSGGALTRDLVEDLRRMFPQSKLFPMYGLTEAFRSTYLDPDLVGDLQLHRSLVHLRDAAVDAARGDDLVADLQRLPELRHLLLPLSHPALLCPTGHYGWGAPSRSQFPLSPLNSRSSLLSRQKSRVRASNRTAS